MEHNRCCMQSNFVDNSRLAARQLPMALDDTLINRVAGQTRSVVDVQFVHQMLPVFLHSLFADLQHIGYYFVGVAFGDQLEDLKLPRSQGILELPLSRSICSLETVLQAFDNGRTKKLIPGAHFSNCLGKRLCRRLLEEVTCGPYFDYSVYMFVVIVT